MIPVICVLLARLSFALALLTPSIANAEPLRINTGVGAPYVQANQKGFLDRLIPEIFRRVGVDAVAVGYEASERAMINANTGIDDGMAMRIKGLETKYPNLLRVDEKIINNDFVAYSIRQRFDTTGFDSLKPYQIAYIIGWKVFEAPLPPGPSITLVQDAQQLFTLLEKDRADIVLFERWQGQWLIRERGIPARLMLPPLATTEMFMYLHKKHAHLVGPLAEALRAAKADGSYQRIFEQSLSKLERR